MRKPAFGNKWLDYHYDHNDPPTQASGPADQTPVPNGFHGFRIFTVKERVFKARSKEPGKWETIRATIRAKEKADQAKGRLTICKFCREFFRTTSEEVGVSVCPACSHKPAANSQQNGNESNTST